MTEQKKVDADAVGRLLLDMEARAHRHGWDQPADLALLSNEQHAEQAYRRFGGRRLARHGDYTAWAVFPPETLVRYPQHRLFRFALNLVHATDEPLVVSMLSVLRQPGFIGTAFVGEGWAGDADPEQRGGRRLADIPGSKEIRLVHAADIDGGYHVVHRERGSKPQLMDEKYQPAGSIYDSLRAITAVVAGRKPPENITAPSMWQWE